MNKHVRFPAFIALLAAGTLVMPVRAQSSVDAAGRERVPMSNLSLAHRADGGFDLVHNSKFKSTSGRRYDKLKREKARLAKLRRAKKKKIAQLRESTKKRAERMAKRAHRKSRAERVAQRKERMKKREPFIEETRRDIARNKKHHVTMRLAPLRDDLMARLMAYDLAGKVASKILKHALGPKKGGWFKTANDAIRIGNKAWHEGAGPATLDIIKKAIRKKMKEKGADGKPKNIATKIAAEADEIVEILQDLQKVRDKYAEVQDGLDRLPDPNKTTNQEETLARTEKAQEEDKNQNNSDEFQEFYEDETGLAKELDDPELAAEDEVKQREEQEQLSKEEAEDDVLEDQERDVDEKIEDEKFDEWKEDHDKQTEKPDSGEKKDDTGDEQESGGKDNPEKNNPDKKDVTGEKDSSKKDSKDDASKKKRNSTESDSGADYEPSISPGVVGIDFKNREMHFGSEEDYRQWKEAEKGVEGVSFGDGPKKESKPWKEFIGGRRYPRGPKSRRRKGKGGAEFDSGDFSFDENYETESTGDSRIDAEIDKAARYLLKKSNDWYRKEIANVKRADLGLNATMDQLKADDERRARAKRKLMFEKTESAKLIQRVHQGLAKHMRQLRQRKLDSRILGWVRRSVQLMNRLNRTRGAGARDAIIRQARDHLIQGRRLGIVPGFLTEAMNKAERR